MTDARPVTMVFPVANARVFDKAVQVVLSAYAGTRRPDRVCVVDNSSDGDFERYYVGADPSLPNQFPPIEVVRFGRNIGLPAVWNYALRRFADWLVLPGDDVVFHNDTLAGMLATADAHPEALIVSPAHITSPRDDQMSPWSFFLQRAASVSLVGLYDEEFYPLYFADNDYAYRMQLAGIGAGVCRANVTAGHWGSATLKATEGPALEHHHATFRTCKQRYVAKWGGEPGRERFTRPFGE